MRLPIVARKATEPHLESRGPIKKQTQPKRIILSLCIVAAALIGWRALAQSESQPARFAEDIARLAWFAGVWASEDETSRNEEQWTWTREKSN
jgi:hypothetical protein